MNTELINKWIESHQPQGKARLAVLAGISVGTLVCILRDGHEPGVDIVRRIARVIGVSLDALAGQESTPAA